MPKRKMSCCRSHARCSIASSLRFEKSSKGKDSLCFSLASPTMQKLGVGMIDSLSPLEPVLRFRERDSAEELLNGFTRMILTERLQSNE